MTLEEYDCLLRIVASSENPPHQIIATLFARFLEWDPNEIVSELSARPLSKLVDRIEDEFLAVGFGSLGFSREYVETRLQPLRDRLNERVLTALSRDKSTLGAYREILRRRPGLGARIVGDTTLGDYYGCDEPADRADRVVKWRAAMQKHAIRTYVALSALGEVGAGALPHWALAAVYLRLLGWDPRRFVAERSKYLLFDLVTLARCDLMQERRIPAALLDDALEALTRRLDRSMDALLEEEVAGLPPDPGGAEAEARATRMEEALGVPAFVAQRPAGRTRMDEYFTSKDTEGQVILWSWAAGACAAS